MGPLFDIAEHFGEEPDYSSELWDRIREEGWFDEPDDVDDDELYHGRHVVWRGMPGRMLRLDWDQLQATQGNPFDFDKVGTFAEIIREGRYGDKPVMGAPPVMLTLVGLDDVAESHQAAQGDELFDSYGMTRPFTTGDEELDEFLADEAAYLDQHEDEERHAVESEMVARAEDALARQEGDLGSVVGYLRDGNHRAFAAQLAGEPDLWVQVRADPGDLEQVGLREEDLE